MNITELTSAAEVLHAVQRGLKIKWLADDDMLTGVLRRICTQDGGFLGDTDVMAEGWIEITSWTTTRMIPFADAVSMHRRGELAITG